MSEIAPYGGYLIFFAIVGVAWVCVQGISDDE